MTIFSKYWGGMASMAPPGYAYGSKSGFFMLQVT